MVIMSAEDWSLERLSYPFIDLLDFPIFGFVLRQVLQSAPSTEVTKAV